MNSGVYKLSLILPNKEIILYVGQTKNLKRRRREHINILELGTHKRTRLQRLFEIYKSGSIKFEILEFVPKENLIDVEYKYISELKPLCNKAFKDAAVCKKIRCNENGIITYGIEEMCKQLRFKSYKSSRVKIYEVINGKRKHHKGYTFSYV